MGRILRKILFYLVVICLLGGGVHLAQASTFGIPGREGDPGRDGSAGRSGGDITVWSQHLDQSVAYHLDGGDGRDGEPGGSGFDATHCFQPTSDSNVRGAPGGDGGRGGRGGYGGRGGDALIYYRQLSDLSKIFISAVGGFGGRGSWGGSAGKGCFCSQYSWSIPRCREVIDSSGNSQQVCDQFDQFYCQNGAHGVSGVSGATGEQGRFGEVTLVQSETELEPENVRTSVDFQHLAKGAVHSMTLTENIFEHKKGILSYLAPGSQVKDYYYSFVRRAVEDIRIEWKAPNTPAPFKGTFSAWISGGDVNFSQETEDIIVTKQSIEDGAHVLTVTEAYNLSEFNIFGIVAEGKRRSLTLRIKGNAPLLDMVSDKVYLSIARKRFLIGYKTEFHGWVPAEVMEYQGKDLLVKIGQLKFDGDDDTFKSGVDLRLRVTVERRVKENLKKMERDVELHVSQ